MFGKGLEATRIKKGRSNNRSWKILHYRTDETALVRLSFSSDSCGSASRTKQNRFC